MKQKKVTYYLIFLPILILIIIVIYSLLNNVTNKEYHTFINNHALEEYKIITPIMNKAQIEQVLEAGIAADVYFDEKNRYAYFLDLPKEMEIIENNEEDKLIRWADPSTLPYGPIVYVFEGKIIQIAYNILEEDFDGNIPENILGDHLMPPIKSIFPSYSSGHEGFEEPHYDIYYYVEEIEDHHHH